MEYTYLVYFEKGDTNYGASVPDLPGCISVADTYEEARLMIAQAIQLHIEGLQEDGQPIPQAHLVKSEPLPANTTSAWITVYVPEKITYKVAVTKSDKLDDDNFREFQSIIRNLSEEQCKKTMRMLILGQPGESAETALFARIADWLMFGEKYGHLTRAEAVKLFKESITEEALRQAWNNCEF